jgi:hypothetical protein
MGERPFTLAARIRTTDPTALQAALTTLIPHGVVTPTSEGFRVEAAVLATWHICSQKGCINSRSIGNFEPILIGLSLGT